MAGAYAYRTMDLSSDSGYTSRFVFSAWVKRSKLSYANAPLFSLHKNNSNTASKINFNFNASDQLSFTMQDSGGSEDSEYQTNRKFRDTNSWYHIYLAFNSTLSTASDRLQIYVNGIRETSFSSANEVGSTFGALMTSAMDFRIGTMKNNSGTAYYFDGLMNSAIFTNYQSGTVDPVTDFGEVDSTTGEWKIKLTPAVTYATQGVFVLKNGNSLTDQSGQSNNMTVGGTLTTTKDCPDNVFATLNPLGSGDVTFSNGNNTATKGGSTFHTAITSLGASSGKYYAEAKAISIGSVTYGSYIGFINLDVTNKQNTPGVNIGEGTDSAGISSGGGYIYYNGNQFAGPTTATTNGDIVNLAMDLDNGRLYWGINGTYLNSGNPASGSTGTGAASIQDLSSVSTSYGQGVYFFAAGLWNTSAAGTYSANFGSAPYAISSGNQDSNGFGNFEFAVPSGYFALCTKNLAEHG